MSFPKARGVDLAASNHDVTLQVGARKPEGTNLSPAQ
jgi:hypothetical protein